LTHTDDQTTNQSDFGFSVLNADPAAEIALVKPNLTPQDVERLVSRRLETLNEQATTVQITMPGDTLLKPGDVLSVASARSTFDGDYIIGSMRRRYSTSAGFIQYVQGYTASATSTVSAGTEISPGE
jgi:hypothetical protein